MKRYEYSFRTVIRFEQAVKNHYFSLKCLPSNFNFQKIYDEEFHLSPSNDFSISRDSFGNKVVYGRLLKEHSHVEYIVKGKAMITAYKSPDHRDWIFKYPTPMTTLNKEMEAFVDALDLPQDIQGKVAAVSHAVFERMTYMPETTQVDTSAIEAWNQGVGVCQDYASITIGMLRYLDIHARYCAGLMLGDGHTHGWVEYYDDGFWYGNDPTNDLLIIDGYIKISHGRDAKDCHVDRGSFNSDQINVKQVVDIAINVGEI